MGPRVLPGGMLVGWVLTTGCVADKAAETADTAPDSARVPATLSIYGTAPWDPLKIEGDDGALPEPELTDASGTPWPTVALQSQGETYAWAPDGDLPAGTYSVTVEDYLLSDGDAAWEVEDYGQDIAFSGDLIIGQVYWFNPGTLWEPIPKGVGSLLVETLSDSYDLYLQVVAVDAGVATFRLLIATRSSGEQCAVFAGDGILSSTGQLAWSADTLDIETDGGTVHTEDLALHLGWLGDGSEAAGAEARAIVDLRVLSAWLMESRDPMEMCDLVAAAGLGACFDCVGDGVASCLDMRVHAGTLTPADLTVDPDLPLCGIDLSAGSVGFPTFSCDVPEFDLDLDCGCAAPRGREGALLVALGLVSALRARRRRSAP